MENLVWIKAQLADYLARTTVVGLVNRVGQKKLGFALGSVSFHGYDDGGANQDAIISFLGSYYGAFLNAKTLAQFRRYNDRSALTYFCRFHELGLLITDTLII